MLLLHKKGEHVVVVADEEGEVEVETTTRSGVSPGGGGGGASAQPNQKRKAQTDLGKRRRRKKKEETTRGEGEEGYKQQAQRVRAIGSGGGGSGTSSATVYKGRTTDFRVLADAFPSLRPYVYTNKYGSASIDWKDPHAVRQVTYALLKHDFGLGLDIPIDQLCPPVPNRANYIYWLQDLLHSNSPQLFVTSGTRVRGLDVGTGASCIYPLLGTKIGGWSFVATDIDETSLRHAQHNVVLNNLEDRIELRHLHPDDLLLGAVKPGEEFAFSMCNPPFFAHLDEACQNPRTRNELVTAGGEVRFVERMIEESLILRHTIRWYTSMIGKKSDLTVLLRALATKGIVNVHTTTFYQGKTTRWGLAWSVTQDGLEGRAKAKSLEKLKGKEEMCFAVSVSDPSALLAHLNDLFRSLHLTLAPLNDPFHLHVEATNTWRDSLPTSTRLRGDMSEPSLDDIKETQRLGDLQVYLNQYDQVLMALVDDPSNTELLELKGSLEELVSLAQQVYGDLEGPPLPAKSAPLIDPLAGGPEQAAAKVNASSVLPHTFQFKVQVLQTQHPQYMVQFTWISGASNSKPAFHDMFDWLKCAITAKFST